LINKRICIFKSLLKEIIKEISENLKSRKLILNKIIMKNSKKLSRVEMKTVQGAIRGCNPQIFCTSPQTECCPGWVCAGIRQYCIAV